MEREAQEQPAALDAFEAEYQVLPAGDTLASPSRL
jgi:hypothetical protein